MTKEEHKKNVRNMDTLEYPLRHIHMHCKAHTRRFFRSILKKKKKQRKSRSWNGEQKKKHARLLYLVYDTVLDLQVHRLTHF